MKTHPRYNKYGLYAYSEGRFTADARDMRFEGIPVLFVPGNAGSYKQGKRSGGFNWCGVLKGRFSEVLGLCCLEEGFER